MVKNNGIRFARLREKAEARKNVLGLKLCLTVEAFEIGQKFYLLQALIIM
jgi:hypothetical protein